MPQTTKPNERSAFAQAALSLDSEFAEFERLARELEKLPIDSESGMERARKLLGHFEGVGERIDEGMHALARNLDEARQRTEAIAQQVTERARAIQERQVQTNEMFERFQKLSDMARQITVAVGQLMQPRETELSSEEKNLILSKLPEVDEKMGVIVDEARKLMDDARHAKLKTLERSADSLRQSLQSARQKLSLVVDTSGPRVTH
jgi:hypothetical protein